MNALVCEMCGSQDLVKQNGLYVCQHCGTKYTVEEAKKLMIEGTVDIKGTVKVDNSKDIENLYQVARRAKKDNNAVSGEKYYDMIMVKDPTSWEASFYVVYFRAYQSKIADIQSASISISNCINTVLGLIKDNVEERNDQINSVKEVAEKCTTIANMLYDSAVHHYNGIDYSIRERYNQELLDRCCAARDIMYKLGDTIDTIFNDYKELNFVAVDAWKNGIIKHTANFRLFRNKSANKSIILGYASKIKKYDSGYVTPTVNGCYVATCVYGSYDCPEVWTLRRYRDFSLAKTWHGRAFIRTYYAISPTLVKWFGNTKWFKKMWRGKLDRMVKKLQDKGYESTRYYDR